MGGSVDIYSNSDVSLTEFKNDLYLYRNAFNFNVYYNTAYNDFGDVTKGIMLKRYRI